MEQQKNIKSVNTHSEQEIQIILSLDYSTTPDGSEIIGLLKVPLNYRTVPIGLENLPQSKRSDESAIIHSRIVEIEDPRFEETYTAYVTRTSTGWNGQIPDVPEVNKCEGTTKPALLTTLKDNLYEVLKARSDAWDKQIEEDIKAGKLEPLREEILEDIQAGRLTDL
ncbi:MAG: hypothetical protein OXD54_03895 [Candidatus Poribacteria bacterium]|nr:hypothetical protein [Candidatus Poribacteria bacterium]